MKGKGRRRRQARKGLADDVSSQKRMAEYLKATQPAFEAAMARVSTLGQSATGVLAGPRMRLKRPSEK